MSEAQLAGGIFVLAVIGLCAGAVFLTHFVTRVRRKLSSGQVTRHQPTSSAGAAAR
jgi:hypothetical protein